MSKSDKQLFTGLKVVAWIIFIGLCIEAGGLIVNFIFSIFNPAFVKNLYQKLDLSALHSQSNASFYAVYSLLLLLALLKAVLFYVVIQLVSKMDLSKPFSSFVADKINAISFWILAIGIISFIGRHFTKHLVGRGYVLEDVFGFWGDSSAYLLMAAVVYIISTIFRKGIELQTENELTV